MSGNEVAIYLGMGCFWGAEKRMWQIPGVSSTRVGYMGGHTDDPDYRQVCTGATGHAEIVEVKYDPAVVATLAILRVFWENHDPTQGDRQGNDVGTQYRSAAYWTTAEQADLLARTAVAYDEVLRSQGFDPITTEIAPAVIDGRQVRRFWPAEEYHQKYLQKNPRGYDCHAHTGILLPQVTAA